MPTGTTAITMGAIASSNASLAMSAMSAANDARCEIVIKTFDNARATVEQQRQFADCIDRFRPMDSGDVLGAKVLVALVLLGALLVPIKLRDGIHDVLDTVMFVLVGAIAGGLLWLLGAAAVFLFS